jgi:hypothetical protein
LSYSLRLPARKHGLISIGMINKNVRHTNRQ